MLKSIALGLAKTYLVRHSVAIDAELRKYGIIVDIDKLLDVIVTVISREIKKHRGK